jgi:hypothetical protein
MANYQNHGRPGKPDVRSDKPPNNWPTVFANKRRKELRVLRDIRVRDRTSTKEITEALRRDGNPELDAKLLGEIIHFTFSEYKAFGQKGQTLSYKLIRHPSTISPCDATQDDMTKYLKEFHRPRKAEARRRRRAELASRRQMAADLDCRFSAVLTLLSHEYQTIGQLMTVLEDHKAFKMPNGKPLRDNSLRVAIHRCLQDDALVGQIDISSEMEKHGKTRLLIRRRQNV